VEQQNVDLVPRARNAARCENAGTPGRVESAGLPDVHSGAPRGTELFRAEGASLEMVASAG